jgi:hypothetical protein
MSTRNSTFHVRLRVDALESRDVPSSVPLAAQQSAVAAAKSLSRVMDQYHGQVGVYEDVDSPGNHFFARAQFPDETSPVHMDERYVVGVHSGATAIRATFSPTIAGQFGGFTFQNGILVGNDTKPGLNFGTVDGGYNLQGATTLTFWARGEFGGERVAFFMGGVGRDQFTGQPEPGKDFPDSALRTPAQGITYLLTNKWKKFTINLAARNLQKVLGGFGWGAGTAENPNGATFYLDDIQYNLGGAARVARLNQPRFLRSFATLPIQSDLNDGNTNNDLDRVLRNTAFVYDNEEALLAYLELGTHDGLRRAKLIGDALVFATQHDKTFTDGRLRSAYRAGDLVLPPGWTPNGIASTIAIPGFSLDDGTFAPVEQSASDTGNNAWGSIALAALFKRTHLIAYRTAAERIGEFIRGFRNDTGTYQGFQGGVSDPEGPAPTPRAYASTEHNLDVAAAFTTLSQLPNAAVYWQTDADHAKQFVEAMWDSSRNVYLAGTSDPENRNASPNQLPEDVQAWSVLVLGPNPPHPDSLDGAIHYHFSLSDGITGFDFNEDRDGVWLEGTAHMAEAFQMVGRTADAEALRRELRLAQKTLPFGDKSGIVAATHDLVTSGFGFNLYRRLHIGATAWLVSAQLEKNPYFAF